jgi:hypothetical protein
MARARKTNDEVLLRAREEAALEELQQLGFRLALYEPREYVDGDPLLGTEAHWKQGVCHAVADARDGRRKTLTGISALDALTQAKAWLRYQQERLSPEQRFVPLLAPPYAMRVTQRIAGDKAETELRRANTERRVISTDGTPHLVDAHGDPIQGDITRLASRLTGRTTPDEYDEPGGDPPSTGRSLQALQRADPRAGARDRC